MCLKYSHMMEDLKGTGFEEGFKLGYLIGRHKGLVRLLELCRSKPYTRELLAELGQWGPGQYVLKLAVRYGLVERMRGEGRRVYNALTPLGERILKLLGSLEENL